MGSLAEAALDSLLTDRAYRHLVHDVAPSSASEKIIKQRVRAGGRPAKRVLRAVLKNTDLCATNPAEVARRRVEGGFTPRYDYAFQTLQQNPYDKWREYDPVDTIRFYALRLREAGMIKSSPQKILAENTDWHFFNELKRELKA